jgi:polysaccharide export outer membrane protein
MALFTSPLTNGVAAAGRFAHDVEASLSNALKSEQILVDPVVKVTVAEYHSRPISVMGAVRKPLTFQAVGAVTLLDALARAEGLSPDAGTEVLVSRPQPSPDSRGEMSATLLERIPLNRLLKDADPAVNYALHGGEEIRVPEAGKIFVLGNVKKPGAFAVHDAGDNSILKMVALSKGAPYAAKQAYIYRREASGISMRSRWSWRKSCSASRPVPLQVDDVLYIPDNKSRRNAVNIIDRITGFGASTASGVLIWHQ